MNQTEITIHNDLTDENNDLITGKFCAPIFICDQNGTLLKDDNELLPNGDKYPRIRSGTLTFVRYKDVIYGITCRHVVEALNKYNEINNNRWLKKFNISEPLPDVAQMHFFIPKDKYQIHVNSDFYFVEGDDFTRDYPDIAITIIEQNVLRLAKRIPIDIEQSSKYHIENYEKAGVVAVGYPELMRGIGGTDVSKINELKISIANIIAHINSITENKVILLSELEKVDCKVDNLSGMSGGPILGTDEKGWGLIGIISKARDVQPKKDSFLENPTVWIEGEKIDIKRLSLWITAIPKIFNFKESLTKYLYIPPNFKG